MVKVDDVCLSTVPGTVGFTTVFSIRPMRALFVDTAGGYADNEGAFVVTAIRI